MTGIQFVTDETGQRIAVQIDLKKHRALWEDIEDANKSIDVTRIAHRRDIYR